MNRTKIGVTDIALEMFAEADDDGSGELSVIEIFCFLPEPGFCIRFVSGPGTQAIGLNIKTAKFKNLKSSIKGYAVDVEFSLLVKLNPNQVNFSARWRSQLKVLLLHPRLPSHAFCQG